MSAIFLLGLGLSFLHMFCSLYCEFVIIICMCITVYYANKIIKSNQIKLNSLITKLFVKALLTGQHTTTTHVT